MKKIVLCLVALLGYFSVSAQLYDASLISVTPSVTITPAGADGEGPITITLHPDHGCHVQGLSLAGWTNANLHSSLITDPAWTQWDLNYLKRFESDAATAFTKNPDGTWSITITPRTWFNVSTTAVPVGQMIGMAFVVNGCPDCNPGPSGIVAADAWLHDQRATYIGNSDGSCADYAIPFPISAALAGCAVIPTPLITAPTGFSFCQGGSTVKCYET